MQCWTCLQKCSPKTEIAACVISDVIMQECAVCSDHDALRQIDDVCMQPVLCDADSDVMIIYQDNIGACLRRINVGYSLMNILYYMKLLLHLIATET